MSVQWKLCTEGEFHVGPRKLQAILRLKRARKSERNADGAREESASPRAIASKIHITVSSFWISTGRLETPGG